MSGSGQQPEPPPLDAWRAAAVNSSSSESECEGRGLKRGWAEVAVSSGGGSSDEGDSDQHEAATGWAAAAAAASSQESSSDPAGDAGRDVAQTPPAAADPPRPDSPEVGLGADDAQREQEAIAPHAGPVEDGLALLRRDGAPSRSQLRAELTAISSCPAATVSTALALIEDLLGQDGLKTNEELYEAALSALTQRRPVSSLKATAAIGGLPAKQMAMSTTVGAAAYMALVWHDISRTMARVVGDAQGCPDAAVLSITEKCRYDETPMHCRALSLSNTAMPAQAPGIVQSGVGGFPLQCALEIAVDSSPAKLLQSELAFAVLLRVRGRYHVMHLQVPTPIQSIQRCSGECVLQALREVTPPVLSMPGLGDTRLQRFVVTDRGSGMLRAERGWNKDRPNVVTLHGNCDVHRCSQVRDWCLRPAETHVKGMIHFALSFREAGASTLFRKALRAVITVRFRFRLGHPPAEVLARNRALLATRWGAHWGKSKSERPAEPMKSTGSESLRFMRSSICG